MGSRIIKSIIKHKLDFSCIWKLGITMVCVTGVLFQSGIMPFDTNQEYNLLVFRTLLVQSNIICAMTYLILAVDLMVYTKLLYRVWLVIIAHFKFVINICKFVFRELFFYLKMLYEHTKDRCWLLSQYTRVYLTRIGTDAHRRNNDHLTIYSIIQKRQKEREASKKNKNLLPPHVNISLYKYKRENKVISSREETRKLSVDRWKNLEPRKVLEKTWILMMGDLHIKRILKHRKQFIVHKMRTSCLVIMIFCGLFEIPKWKLDIDLYTIEGISILLLAILVPVICILDWLIFTIKGRWKMGDVITAPVILTLHLFYIHTTAASYSRNSDFQYPYPIPQVETYDARVVLGIVLGGVFLSIIIGLLYFVVDNYWGGNLVWANRKYYLWKVVQRKIQGGKK